MEKTNAKDIQFELVLEGKTMKNTNRPIAAAPPRGSPIKQRKENPSNNFTEYVKLCCVTMTAGPSTAFGDYQIPQVDKCSLCGSGLQKGRM